MIRRPTPASEIFAWHRAALAGRFPPVDEAEPQVGWYRTRMVKGGPFVPARIWLEREIDPETGDLASDEILRCEIDGQPRDPYRVWIGIARHSISRAEYEALRALPERVGAMKATHVEIDLTREVMRP